MTTPVAPQARLVVLGASNVARGIRNIVLIARGLEQKPVEVVTAMGHGRAYGVSTWAPFRRLPAIIECGLWPALAQHNHLPTRVLVTDIGNDLVFGQSPAMLMANVRSCVDRLRSHSTHIMLTTPPVESIRQLSPWKFQLFRRLLFPKATITLSEAQHNAESLHELIQRYCESEDLKLYRVPMKWYGFDPIHIRSTQQHQAWNDLLSALHKKNIVIPKIFFQTFNAWKSLRSLLPEQSVVSRGMRHVTQPSAQLNDGTRVSFY
jgi:hypothetical protein